MAVTVTVVTVDLRTLLAPDGVRPVRDVLTEVDKNSVTRWVAGGQLTRPLPGVLALPAAIGTWHGRATAAVQWSGGHLSGRSALASWDLVAGPGPRVHLAIGRRRHVPPVPDWLRPHRVEVPVWGVGGGFAVTLPARSLVEAWGHAHARDGSARDVEIVRGAVIGAVRRRTCSVREIRRELARHPRLPGRGGLVSLLALVENGSQSEFEIWGLAHLLDIPGLPPVQQQLALDTRIGTIHFDGGWEAARLGVELDGATYHRQPDQHEYDLRRDSAVVAADWVTIRVSYRRGHQEPDACRDEIATAYWARIDS